MSSLRANKSRETKQRHRAPKRLRFQVLVTMRRVPLQDDGADYIVAEGEPHVIAARQLPKRELALVRAPLEEGGAFDVVHVRHWPNSAKVMLTVDAGADDGKRGEARRKWIAERIR